MPSDRLPIATKASRRWGSPGSDCRKLPGDAAVKQVKRHLIRKKSSMPGKPTLADEEVEAGLQEVADAFQQPVEQVESFYNQNTEKPD